MHVEARWGRTLGTFVHCSAFAEASNRSYVNVLNANSLWLAIHLKQNTRKAKNEKCIVGYFVPFFSRFALLFSLFLFCIRVGIHAKTKDFVVYFFAALIKHKICMKCEKCIVSVSYFVVCFVKNTRKMRKVYSRPLKYRQSMDSIRLFAKVHCPAKCCWPRLGNTSTLNYHFIFACRICLLFVLRCKPGLRSWKAVCLTR